MNTQNFKVLANVFASLLGGSAGIYVLTFQMSDAFRVFSSGGVSYGYNINAHSLAVLAMIIFFNAAIACRFYYWYLQPNRNPSAWNLLLVADGIAVLLLAAAIYYFTSTQIIEFIALDSRIVVLGLLYVLTQILQIVARSMLNSHARKMI